jgi:hypothetical protein
MENKVNVAIYGSNIFYGVSNGETIEEATENVCLEVYNNLTKFDNSRDDFNYK